MAEAEKDKSTMGVNPVSMFDFSRGSLLASQSRISKPAFNFMDKRQTHRVLEGDVDVTPDNIIDPQYVTMEDIFTHAAYETRPRGKSEGLKASSTKSKTMIGGASKSAIDMGMKVYATTISLDDIHIDHTYNTEEGITFDEAALEIAPSAFYLPKAYPVMTYPPELFVVLKETETVFNFELPSFSYDKGTAEGNEIEEENEYYLYMTVGKGRNRKTIAEETQTKECVVQSRTTLAVRPQKKNAMSFAAMWDMHDTYARLANVRPDDEPDEMVLYQTAPPNLMRKKKKQLAEHSERRGKTFDEIRNTPQFFDAVLLTERVLASLEYGEAQKTFRGLVQMDPLSLDLVYVYSLRPLWTFECEDTINRPISCIAFNPRNEDILAVGHGRFCYAENYGGLVCVWCTKNPCVPERLYRFDDPVTSLAFSEKNPNWLACGFYNGDVLILDVTAHAVRTVARSKRETNPCFEPIWSTGWRATDDGEYVMTACQDGRINRFTSTKTHDFICSPMMRLSTVEGETKGVEAARSRARADVGVSRAPAALCVLWHPRVPHVYMVGSGEGCVHSCSTHYLTQHVGVFRAHAGPALSAQLSPFLPALLATCGADGAVRLWLEGIDDPVMTLPCAAAVNGVAFCPVNATVLVSVAGGSLAVWDLRRKTHVPCADYQFPASVTLTYIKFSTSGDNLFVGDTAGRVHTFHLEDTPIAPYYQQHMLQDAIRRALCTRPQLLRQLDKLEKFREKHK